MYSDKNCRAFSLMELLVVSAILALLLAISLPIWGYVQATTRRVGCINHLRQCGIAMLLYAQRYHGCLPHEDDDNGQGYSYCWYNRLDDLLPGKDPVRLKQCPAINYQAYQGQHSYKMNSKLCDGISPTDPHYFARLSRIRQQVRAVYPTHWRRQVSLHTIVLLIDGAVGPVHGRYHKTHLGRVANRHEGGPNILYCDGSVRFWDATQAGVARGLVGLKYDFPGIFWGGEYIAK